MSEPNIIAPEDEARLQLTLNTREQIIRSLMSDGIPKDTDDRDFLMKALDGLDRTVLTKTKIKTDDKNAAGEKEASKLIAEMLKRITVGPNATRRTESPVLDNEFDITDIVKDETSIGLQDLNYDDFVNAN